MKIMIVASYDRSLVNFRTPLIRALLARGHEVVACAPAETPEVPEQLRALGARFVAVTFQRTGLNPLIDLGTCLRLHRLFAAERPDAVLTYTIKPVIYGSLAAAWAGVPRIYAMITGLGTALANDSPRWMRLVATTLYRLALRRCRGVFTQNPEIADFLLKARIVKPHQVIPVRGSGVDLAHYNYVPVKTDGGPSFLLLARLLSYKGIYEYVEAARLVKARFPQTRFRLAGQADTNPTAIPIATVQRWHDEGVIEYLQFQSDVRPFLETCTVYVLPSYYEGIPRSVLEAMAVGRPIITTDAIGCRETVKLSGHSPGRGGVIQGENGFLVPVRSATALAEAMCALAADPALAAEMGRRSRVIVEAEFDADKISEGMIAAMKL